ncbi:MAG: hypothetical protein A2044_07445 [Candidatus Firestonebacteria bacterium GWA2_43_8]|nr:MAG: hypothetical protein A2044_07445 [Candidatus Firestonebacteria bacterium GWA2_43_8]
MKKVMIFTISLFFCFCMQVQGRNLHLTWEDDPKTTMTLNWQDSDKKESKVKYGLTAKVLDKTADARVEKIANIGTVKEKNKRKKVDKGFLYIYKAKLSDLKPSTQYYYLVESEGSDVHTFTTAPEGNDNFTFIAGGDNCGNNKPVAELIKMAQRFNPRFFIHNGDILAPADDVGDWNDFFKALLPLGFSMPIMPTPGNHDQDDDSDFKNYLARFALPQAKDAGLNYSFDYGNVHFVSALAAAQAPLSISKLSSTASWLAKDLASTKKKYKIVYAHAPLVSSGDHGIDEKAKSLFTPIFDKYHVDLYINGHDHGYERSKPVNFTLAEESAQKTYKEGTCYLVTGGMGAPFYDFGGDWWTAKLIPQVHHLVRVDVSEEKLHIQTLDKGGQILDDFNIEK